MSDLEILRQARDLLDRSYVKWTEDDGHGGHCAVGAVVRVAGWPRFVRLAPILNATAKVLHPELINAEGARPRERGYWSDSFNTHPVVYLNNQVGKEAALQVFDTLILEMEIKEQMTEITPEEVTA